MRIKQGTSLSKAYQAIERSFTAIISSIQEIETTLNKHLQADDHFMS